MRQSPIIDSLVFLSIARTTLKEAIKTNDVAKKKEIQNFIMNEASDYEVMSLLIDEVLPENKYDTLAESQLWDKFKRQVTRNYNVLSEQMGTNSLENVIFELGPVSELGLSSATPILEFHHQMGMLNEVDVRSLKYAGKGAVAGAKVGYKAGKILGKGILGKTKLGIKGGELGAKVGYKIGKATSATLGALKKVGDVSGASAIGAKIGVGSVGAGLGALGAAALLAYGAYKTYQRFFSKAAKACSSSPDKTACMKKFKVDAIKAQIADLSKGAAACGKTKDPGACKTAIAKKIKKLQIKMASAAK
jgi:hypothetical protein